MASQNAAERRAMVQALFAKVGLQPRQMGAGAGDQSADEFTGTGTGCPTCSSPTTGRWWSVSHGVAVMYPGRIVEYTDKATIFAKPLHPYTQALMAAVPAADPSVRRDKKHVMGDVPSPIHRPTGCHFHPRCKLAEPRCRAERPVLREVLPGHRVACHLV
jgi:oligopeptide/dipeptide ABC transporter ATP-binding protein